MNYLEDEMSKKTTIVLLFIIGALVMSACGGATPPPTEAAATEAPAAATAAPAAATEAPAAGSSVKELKILWAQWDPADYLQKVANAYETEKGVKVTVVQEPWGSFGTRFYAEMAAKGTAWDMVVGDSQWLGAGATKGWYVDLTDFMAKNNITDSVTPATLKFYGEYPAGSKKYYAYPTEGDADGWAYRKDLFEDPAEKAAFKAKYGYDLAPPDTYAQLKDIAQFFTRPDKNLYGVAIYTQKDYDAITMGVENTFFSWGATWQDSNNNVKGVVNSKEAVDALQFYRDLYKCCQAPGLSNAFFTETNNALISGQSVMIMNYFAFFPALVNPSTNKNFADKTGFFVNPKGPTGKQSAALGGQGLSIVAYGDDAHKQAAMDFLKWFASDDVQAKWAAAGGYTCNNKALASDAFLKGQPYNPAFAKTMTFVQDFWNIPEYAQLLTVSQTDLSKFVVGGEGTAQAAMDDIAAQHDKILREAGYIK
jgi:multiple sugar transport system substrate-binding protein